MTRTITIGRATALTALAALLLIGAGCLPAAQAPAPQQPPAPSTTGQEPTPTPAPSPAPSADENAPAPRPGGPTGAMIIRPNGNSLYVAAQRPGKTLIVTLLTLKDPGFVVIREKDAMTGTELGKTDLVPGGDDNGQKIDLSREMKDGETLYAAIYIDNGDGRLDEADAPAMRGPDDPYWVEFKVSATAPEHPVINF